MTMPDRASALLRSGRCRLLRIGVLGLALLGSAQSAAHPGIHAEAQRPILVLNSDASIEKYRICATAFREKAPRAVVELDLGGAAGEEALREAIQRNDPALVYCIGTKALSLSEALPRRPAMLFSSVLNWRRLTLGRATWGVSSEPPPEMQLTLFKYFFPSLKRVGLLTSEVYGRALAQAAGRTARELGLELVHRSVKPGADMGLAGFMEQVDALWMIPDPDLLSSRAAVQALFLSAHAAKKPVFTYDEIFLDMGPTLVLCVDIPTLGRQAAEVAALLVDGGKPNTRVQDPAGTRITLDRRKVEAYGLELNGAALDSVYRILR